MTTPMETKIAALIAKAEGTDNAHEAEAFMAKAEELMLQYGIERANLQAHTPGTKREEIVTQHVYIKNGHGYADAMGRIGFNIAPSFSIKVYHSKHSDGARTMWFVGHKSDVEQAVYLFNSLVVQAKPQAVRWWKTEGKPANPWASDNEAYLQRREFIYAFASGVGQRLAETRNRVVAEAEAGTALVLVDRAKVVDEWVNSNMSFSRGRSTARKVGGYDARVAGQQAGRDALSNKEIR